MPPVADFTSSVRLAPATFPRGEGSESVANKRALQVSYAERSRATIVSLTERRETEGIIPHRRTSSVSVSAGTRLFLDKPLPHIYHKNNGSQQCPGGLQ